MSPDGGLNNVTCRFVFRIIVQTDLPCVGELINIFKVLPTPHDV